MCGLFLTAPGPPGVAEIILDCGVKAVAESVPVGLTEMVGASETVGVLLVVAGAVVKFPATEGVTSGVTIDVSAVEPDGVTSGVLVAVLLFPVSGGIVGVFVGVMVLVSVGVTVLL